MNASIPQLHTSRSPSQYLQFPLGGQNAMQSGAITKRRGVQLQLPFGPWHFTAMANISLSCVSVSATPTVRTNSDGGGRKEGRIDARFGDLGALSGWFEKPTRKCHFSRVFGRHSFGRKRAYFGDNKWLTIKGKEGVALT